MPTFQFEAVDRTGKPQRGAIEAPSEDDAYAQIKGQGYFPTSVREQKVRSRQRKSGTPTAATAAAPRAKKRGGEITINIGGVSKKKLTAFTRQMSTLQDAGLPILRSLNILAAQQKPGLLKNAVEDVAADVEGGSSLSDAMHKHPRVFDKLYAKMIAAGEVSGTLDVILQRLAEFMEKAQALKRKIIGAMIYPAVVISVACLIVLGIMIFVVPKFAQIFEDFDTELPLLTKGLIGTSLWLAGRPPYGFPGAIWLLGAPVVFFVAFNLLRRSSGGKRALDAFKLQIPVFGKLLRFTAIARFTRTLGTLINAGVPILEGILITRDTVGNHQFERALQNVHDAIREGESIAGPLRESRVVDEIVVNMIDVGEETGELDKMLMRVADNYDEQVDVMVGALVSLLEPIMVVALGGIVGFIVISLFLPLVKLIQGLT